MEDWEDMFAGTFDALPGLLVGAIWGDRVRLEAWKTVLLRGGGEMSKLSEVEEPKQSVVSLIRDLQLQRGRRVLGRVK